MSGALIAIEISAQDSVSPNRVALVRACNQSVGTAAECALLSEINARSPTALAVVSWADAQHLVVRIEAGPSGAARSEWHARELRFVTADSEVERWRAAGLAIAILVGQREMDPTVSEPRPVVAMPPHPGQKPSHSAPQEQVSPRFDPRRAARFTLGAGAEVARGASGALGAQGVGLTLTHGLGALPLLAVGSLSYTREFHAVERVGLEHVDVGAGAGAAAVIGPFVIAARLEPVITWVRASLSSGHGSKAGFLLGVQGDTDLSYWWTRQLGVWFSVGLTESTARTLVRVSTQGATAGPWAVVPEPVWHGSLGFVIGLD